MQFDEFDTAPVGKGRHVHFLMAHVNHAGPRRTQQLFGDCNARSERIITFGDVFAEFNVRFVGRSELLKKHLLFLAVDVDQILLLVCVLLALGLGRCGRWRDVVWSLDGLYFDYLGLYGPWLLGFGSSLL